jgi:hypothetical protein
MIVRRLNLTEELRLIAHGKPAHLPVDIIAGWALDYLRTIPELSAPKGDELEFLDAMYCLEDPRP